MADRAKRFKPTLDPDAEEGKENDGSSDDSSEHEEAMMEPSQQQQPTLAAPPAPRRRVVLAAREEDDLESEAHSDDGARGERAQGLSGDEYDDEKEEYLVNDDEEDDDEGEDLLENAPADYVENKVLDAFDASALDDTEQVELDIEGRFEVEAKLAERDRLIQLQSGKVRRPGGLEDDLEGVDDEHEADAKRAYKLKKARSIRNRDLFHRALRTLDESAVEEVDEEAPLGVDLENFQTSLGQYLGREDVVGEIKRRFRVFLQTFVASESTRHPVYASRISAMCASNSQSLIVSFRHLCEAEPNLAVMLADDPRTILPLLDDVARVVVLEAYPTYDRVHQTIKVRVSELSAHCTLRELRCTLLNAMVRVSGVVTRRTAVLPMLKLVRYKCTACKETSEAFDRTSIKPSVCPTCATTGCMQVDSERVAYANYQRLTLQESPGTVPAGRVPRQKDVVLLDDLIDSCRPGEEVEITGVFISTLDLGLNNQNGFPVFFTHVEANHVQKREDSLQANIRVTEEDKKELRAIAADPNVLDRLVGSVAPSIYGKTHVKTALALAMFGGREKNIENKHRVRGDINVLLLGDPGTAKSQCLKYVEKTAPRAVFTTGKGASAVGLTASVHKDPVTREWTLEGGALVLADRGVCLIDEFDKMNEKDRTSIHEAMEQQSISISKAGIVTTLQARCSVIAAANPIAGRYDPQRSFSENVELTDPILQRFDVLCVLQDQVDVFEDERLAKFVVSSHVRSHPSSHASENLYDGYVRDIRPSGGLLDQELFKKYVVHAKSLRPILNREQLDVNKFREVYVKLRKESTTHGGIPIAVRHMESMIRLSEAFARMHLREYVLQDDVNMAIRVMIESFILAQRFAVQKPLRHSFREYIVFKRDHDDLLMTVLERCFKELETYAPTAADEPDEDEDDASLGEDGSAGAGPKPPRARRYPLADFQRYASELGLERRVSEFLQSSRFARAGFIFKDAMIEYTATAR